MKIAFAAEENKGVEGLLAYHFGRCPYYVFVEIENNEIKNVETKENPYYDRHEPGVVPQFIAGEGAKRRQGNYSRGNGSESNRLV